ncbi:S41 family peptidase [Dyadobacter chenwenxiniae]|uniref:S41 family peptidase n=1 Tax=Dyadobacter chenwenxiniae TaxID=2906456 RepID=A0A9X1TFP9_9BACT|nr:S41 family peptidase [Dyadobacter chenwenxiniae]MCF0063207.1 S41 family peptidase [Dyadobacter chenwenxiniae]UON85413.1 S41 family peptidase [Dyadobacter chenwenxiniae]
MKFIAKTLLTLYAILHSEFGYAETIQNLQNQSDSLQIARIASFGKVWGVINYFHPTTGKGVLAVDSLVISNIGALLDDPTAKGFQKALSAMFSNLNDAHSGIIDKKGLTIYTTDIEPDLKLSSPTAGILYVTAPQSIFRKHLALDSVLTPEVIASHRSFIIDLRNTAIDNNAGLKQYTQLVQPLVGKLINRTLILPTARSFYYKGLMRQDFPHDINILPQDEKGEIVGHLQVHYGIRSVSEGGYLLSKQDTSLKSKRFCFVVNRYVNVNTLKALLALRNRNLCNIIFQGEMPDYVYGDFHSMELPDNISVKIRTSELIYEDGTFGSTPDAYIASQSGTDSQQLIIKEAGRLFSHPIKHALPKQVENTVFIRKPQFDYPSKQVPDLKLRLLGLFNFWNAIYYFSPNKNLIPGDWSKVLTHFIPKFIKAENDSLYFLALMELTTSIQDGHSILINKRGGRSPFGIMDGNLPIGTDVVDNKVFITSVLADTAQRHNLSQLKEGDELIAIDHVPVSTLAKRWEKLIVASNKAGFSREYYFTWLTNGALGSTAIITVLSHGQVKDIVLRRIKRDDYYNLRGKINRFPLKEPFCQILEPGIGYMRINRLFVHQLDSLSRMLKDCNSIILDARGYPRDSHIGTELASYIAAKPDTVAYNEFPFVTSPVLSKNHLLIEHEIIQPNSNKFLKDKKYFILVDEGIQSQGEWNVIALQGVTRATTIGTQTAGANGMAITINFPGQYFSFFSGFGEYYPDGTPNQKLGVKIDIPINKTLRGFLNGDDEILQRALSEIRR